VISAYLSGVVEGDTIVGWTKNSAFTVQEVCPMAAARSFFPSPTRGEGNSSSQIVLSSFQYLIELFAWTILLGCI
jgi:hypothetical protein